jgi:hypothetical protein
MAWFRKTSVYNYNELDDELKYHADINIDKRIEHVYQTSKYGEYMFQFYVANSIALTHDSYVKNIPTIAYFESVARILSSKSYIIHPNGDDYYYTVCIAHNLSSSIPIPHPIGTRLARAAIYQAKDANEICAITLEPLRSLTSFAVSQCGHVFDESAAALDICPLCKAPVAWTVCSPAPEPVLIRKL